MTNTNYSKIYQNLVQDLPQRTKEVFERRFGIKDKKETLESIGQGLGITRERVRQIEERGFSYLKEQNQEILDKLFNNFSGYFENKGGLKREDIALKDLGGKTSQPYVLFLLTLGEQFSRVCEKGDFYSFWTTIPKSVGKVGKTLDLLVKNLEKRGRPLIKKDFCSRFCSQYSLSSEALLSYLEVSKRIQENKEGKIGLIDWPEINPKGVKDKAFLVFKKENHPLHFKEVAGLIDKLESALLNRKTLPQTVHNELIKDSRFVLVGRGMYALGEWGYVPGTVKDVIYRIIEENKQPMERDKIIKGVLSQRCVAENTVVMNLNNKKYFSKDPKGKYILGKTQIA